MACVVITGVNGFVGKHLASELVDAGHSVIGIGRERQAQGQIAKKLDEYACVDLTQTWPTLKHKPDAIVHLAGLAAVGPSFDAPQDYIGLNSAIVTNMCEHYLKADKKPRIVLVSSGAIYDAQQPMPITESSPVSFSSPYAVSKILNEHQAAYYNGRGLDCVVMRPFNHIGPNQLPGFLVPDLAQKILDRSDDDEPIIVGNLETKRDYTDVRDVARAYVAVATSEQKPAALVYNVCSGVSRSGNEVLAALTDALNVNPPQTSIDQSLIRPNDVMDIRGDSSLLTNEFGWKPSYNFEQTIRDFVQSL